MEASERRDYKPMDCKFLRDEGLLCMLYVGGCKLPVLGHLWSRYVFDLACTLLSLSVLKIMNKLPTLKNIRGLHVNPVKFLSQKMGRCSSSWACIAGGLWWGSSSSWLPTALAVCLFTKRQESFVVS